jgi:hypothetical protein
VRDEGGKKLIVKANAMSMAEDCGEKKYNYSLLTHFELTGIMKCSAGGGGRNRKCCKNIKLIEV